MMPYAGRVRLAVILLLGVVLGGAADRPQFLWEGEARGRVVLSVRGKKLTVNIDEGEVERSKLVMPKGLPDSRQTVRLELRKQRGMVSITQQPRIDNDYTLEITIDDRQDGLGGYSIAAYWDLDRGTFDPPEQPPKRKR